VGVAEAGALTDVTDRNLPVLARGAKLWGCDQFDGFGGRVLQAGTKAFVLTYAKHRERVTIGHYPILTLADAALRQCTSWPSGSWASTARLA